MLAIGGASWQEEWICHKISIRVFSIESALSIMWPKYWSFSFSISPSNEYLELFSFRIHWFDLFAVQGTLESSPASQLNPLLAGDTGHRGGLLAAVAFAHPEHAVWREEGTVSPVPH